MCYMVGMVSENNRNQFKSFVGLMQKKASTKEPAAQAQYNSDGDQEKFELVTDLIRKKIQQGK